MQKFGQREYMRKLFKELGDNEDAVCLAYAQGEREEVVLRRSKVTQLKPELYARALWNDGKRKGWLHS